MGQLINRHSYMQPPLTCFKFPSVLIMAGGGIMNRNFWSQLGCAAKIGITFFCIAVALSLVGVLRNPDTPATMQSVLIATTISGLVWGIIAWAIATAALDVEEEIAERDGTPLE